MKILAPGFSLALPWLLWLSEAGVNRRSVYTVLSLCNSDFQMDKSFLKKKYEVVAHVENKISKILL